MGLVRGDVRIQVSAFLAVGVVPLVIAWIGYALATPPSPLEDFDFESEAS